jgi:hypothetical protein
MPHKIKSGAEHYTGLKPANRRDQRSLLKLCLYAILAIAAVIGLRVLQQHWQQVRELTWSSATGTILDARRDPSQPVSFGYNSNMLYRTQVLVSFSLDGSPQQRWITLRKSFESPEAIRFDAQRWKGAQCTVRWNPSNPNQIDAEVA